MEASLYSLISGGSLQPALRFDAYLTRRIATEKVWYESQYDEIMIPAELDGVHPKAAIGLRNRWMVDHSDFVVAAIHRDFGGAAEAVLYAEERSKEVLQIFAE